MDPPHELEHYDMSKSKILLILNNKEFPQDGRLAPLPSNDLDQERLTRVFTAFGFRVEPHVNLTADQILNVFARYSGGTLHAADCTYNLNDLVEKLQFNHPGLVGRPKLFLVQACRGGDLDSGRDEFDGPGGAALGTHTDTLVFTACIEGFVAWGHGGGSWLLQELCGVLERHRELHLLDITTLTTSLVTRGHAALVLDAPETPQTCSTLTKLLRFSRAQR